MSNETVTIDPGVAAIMRLWGWETMEEMGKAEAYRSAMREAGNVKRKALDILETRETTLNGWFVQMRDRLKNEGTKAKPKWIIEGQDALVLGENGIRFRIPVPDGFKPSRMATVQVDPVTVRVSLKHPERQPRVSIDRKNPPSVNLAEHDSQVPRVSIERLITSASERGATKGKSGEYELGVVSGAAEGLLTGEVTSDLGDIFVDDGQGQYSKFPHVRVPVLASAIVQDEDGNDQEILKYVNSKIPAEVIEEQLGLTIGEDDPQSIKDEVAEEPVALNGTLRILTPLNVSRNDDGEVEGHGFDEPEEALAWVEDPQNSDLLSTHEESGKVQLDLRNYDEEFVDIAGKRVYGIEFNPKEEKWMFQVSCDAEDRPYSMDVREHPYVDRNDVKRVNNKGAFAVFLNYAHMDTNPTEDLRDRVADALPDIE